MEESKVVQMEGWCHIVDTVCQGPEISWKTGEGDNTLPVLWATQEEARKELIQEYIYHLESYIDGHRDWDSTDTAGPEDYVAYCKISADGTMEVYEDDSQYTIIVMKTTLKEWREGL